MQDLTHNRYVGQDELVERIGLSPNTFRNLEKEGRFPKRRKLTKRAVAWWLPDVEAWIRDPEGWKETQAK